MFCNSSLAARPSCAHTATPLYAERRGRRATRRAHEHPQVPSLLLLGESVQISENTATLSPFPATLTDRVKHKPFVCHSYGKHRGVGVPLRGRCPSLTSRGNRGICFFTLKRELSSRFSLLTIHFRVPRAIVCFHTLTHSLAPRKTLSPIFSALPALFAQNTRGRGISSVQFSSVSPRGSAISAPLRYPFPLLAVRRQHASRFFSLLLCISKVANFRRSMG